MHQDALQRILPVTLRQAVTEPVVPVVAFHSAAIWQLAEVNRAGLQRWMTSKFQSRTYFDQMQLAIER